MGGLPADLKDLLGIVVSRVPMLLAAQDADPDAPTRGCFHPAYWRDKTSDVADQRRQEAVLALALLHTHELPGNPWRGERRLRDAAFRGMGFWVRSQHADGTFDEWYRNEHGYATTAFSGFAMALALDTLGDAVPGPLVEAVHRALSRAGAWLATHDDWFKTNHEAVGVAALGAIGRRLQDPLLLDSARRNALLLATRQHEEGWFPEISGTDVGYAFLLAEYLALHAVLTGDPVALPAAARAYRFAVDFLHPDLTTGAEYGICANPYVSRLATVALAPHEPLARAVLGWMERPGPREVAATLDDELRLARYAFQPLLAALLHLARFPRRDAAPSGDGTPPELPFLAMRREAWHPGAGLLATARPAYAAWAAPVQGGAVRVAFRRGDGFDPPGLDRGFVVDHGPRRHRNARYGRDHEARFESPGVLEVTAALRPVGFVQPPYLARVLLRTATAFPGGPRAARWAIDRWRRRKGTALNQSTAGVAAGRPRFVLERRLEFEDDHVLLHDRLRALEGGLDPGSVHLALDPGILVAGRLRADADCRIPLSALGIQARGPEIRIRRRWTREGMELLD
jgi:hypothetical protein